MEDYFRLENYRVFARIFLGFLFVLSLLGYLFVALYETGNDNLPSIGMKCFHSCKDVCVQKSSKVMSFTANNDGVCGCTCYEGSQQFFKIVDKKS